MRTEAGFKRVVGRVGDDGGIVRAHEKERRIAVDQRGAEAFVDTVLRAQMAVHIVGSIERIVCGGDVAGENRSVDFSFRPVACMHGIGQFRAVHADLPGEQAIGFELGSAKPGNGRFVIARN